jgi:hypothetical protein
MFQVSEWCLLTTLDGGRSGNDLGPPAVTELSTRPPWRSSASVPASNILSPQRLERPEGGRPPVLRSQQPPHGTLSIAAETRTVAPHFVHVHRVRQSVGGTFDDGGPARATPRNQDVINRPRIHTS